MIKEIKLLDDGKFEIIDENIQSLSLVKLKEILAELDHQKIEGQKLLLLVNSNHKKVSAAIETYEKSQKIQKMKESVGKVQ